MKRVARVRQRQLNYLLSTCQRKNCKKITEAFATVASIDQNLLIEQNTFFLNQRSAVNDVNFQQTLQREACRDT